MKLSSVFFGVMIFWASGCSSGPPSPKPGSPGFFWAVARESYRTGDLVKTNSILLELAKGESEFSERAEIWHLVLSAGMSQGYSELADAYEAGAGTNLTSSLRFRNEGCALRSLAANTALEFTQSVHDLVDNPAAKLPLSFAYPSGSAGEPEGVRRISSGVWISDAERESVQTAMLERWVLLTVSRAVGHPGDPVRALAVFQSQPVQVQREALLFQMAGLLYEESDLFGPQRMDRPNRRLLMCSEALRALRSLPPSDDSQKLAAEIQDTVKKIAGPGA